MQTNYGRFQVRNGEWVLCSWKVYNDHWHSIHIVAYSSFTNTHRWIDYGVQDNRFVEAVSWQNFTDTEQLQILEANLNE